MIRRGVLLVVAGAATAWLLRRQGVLGPGRAEVLPWREDAEAPAPVEPRPVESTTEEVAAEAMEEPADDDAVSEAGIVDAEVVAEPEDGDADAPTVEADALAEADVEAAPGAAGVAEVVDDLLTAPVRPPENGDPDDETPANSR